LIITKFLTEYPEYVDEYKDLYNIDSPGQGTIENGVQYSYCDRQFPDWSTPYQNFFGTSTSRGSENSQFNLKVIYATAPYISALEGTPDTYYESDLTGSLSISDTNPESGNTITVTASFTNDIHDDYTPSLKFTSDSKTSTIAMGKTDSKTYSVDYTITTEEGSVLLDFVDGRGIFGEYLVEDPTGTDSFYVDIPDTAAPIVFLSLPNDNSEHTLGDSITFAATASDAVDGDLTADIEWTSNHDGIIGTGGDFTSSSLSVNTHTIQATVEDAAGNEGFNQVMITVLADIVPPFITLTGDNPQTIELGDGYTELGATTDDGSVVIIDDTAFVDAIGTYSIFYDSVDASGNVAIQVIRTVDVVDTTPPVITLNNPDQNPQTIELGDGYTELGATTDDGSVVTIDDTAFVDAVGSYSILYDSVDAAGNDAIQVIRTVTVIKSNIAPTVIISSPLDNSLFDDSDIISFTGTAVDVEDGDITASLTWTSDIDGTIGSGGSFTVSLTSGIHTITADVADSESLSNSEIITVTVNDTIAPSFMFVPLDQTFEATAVQTPLTSDNYGIATATDYADPNPIVTNNATATFALGDTIIQWNATDSSGNSAYATQTITIEDKTVPSIIIPEPYVIDADTGSIPIFLDESDYGTATATDIFTPILITHNATGYLFPEGDTIIQWNATDPNGNIASGMQKITVNALELFYESYTFDSGTLEGWIMNFTVGTYDPVPDWPFHDYDVTISNTYGNSPPALLISGDGFVSATFAEKTFDVSNANNVHLSLDYRAISDFAGSCVTNARIQIVDQATDTQLYSEKLACGGTYDTGIQQYYKDITDIVKDYDSIVVSGWLNDSWIANWSQKTMFDNIIVSENPPVLSLVFLTSSNSFNTFIQPKSFPSQVNSTYPEPIPTDKPPIMYIVTPRDGTTIPQDYLRFRLGVTISDDIDGNINNKVQWNSDVDGFLGDGKHINRPNLSIGVHTITASVTDSGGNHVEDTISITIIP